jgi:hypothetical protein
LRSSLLNVLEKVSTQPTRINNLSKKQLAVSIKTMAKAPEPEPNLETTA